MAKTVFLKKMIFRQNFPYFCKPIKTNKLSITCLKQITLFYIICSLDFINYCILQSLQLLIKIQHPGGLSFFKFQMGPCITKPNVQNKIKSKKNLSNNVRSQKNSGSTAEEMNIEGLQFQPATLKQKNNKSGKEKKERKFYSDPTWNRQNHIAKIGAASQNRQVEPYIAEPINNSEIIIKMDQDQQRVQTKCVQNINKRPISFIQYLNKSENVATNQMKSQPHSQSILQTRNSKIKQKKQLKQFISNDLQLRQTFVAKKNNSQQSKEIAQYKKSIPKLIQSTHQKYNHLYQRQIKSVCLQIENPTAQEIQNQRIRNQIIENNQIKFRIKRYEAGLSVISEASGREEKTMGLSSNLFSSGLAKSNEIRRSSKKSDQKPEIKSMSNQPDSLRKSNVENSRFGPKLEFKSGQLPVMVISE